MKYNVCTKEKPYVKGMSGSWQHPNAIEVSVLDINYITYVTYKCPICGLIFECELPD